eukprot:scaffold57645_cov31-Tisochrysis_lutea.AAC.1
MKGGGGGRTSAPYLSPSSKYAMNCSKQNVRVLLVEQFHDSRAEDAFMKTFPRLGGQLEAPPPSPPPPSPSPPSPPPPSPPPPSPPPPSR